MAEGLPTEQAVRPRRTLRSRKAVYLAGIVFALRPAGGKPHDCRCGQGVGEMPVPACQRAGMFSAVTAAPVGIVAEPKGNRRKAAQVASCIHLEPLYKTKILSQILEIRPAMCYYKHGLI